MDGVMGFLIGLALGFCLGAALVGGSWENDCKTLGATRSSGHVYECKLTK
jgi:hypothetical protein